MIERISAAEYRAMQQRQGRGNKYNAQKTGLDGKTYASRREAYRAAELKALQKAGEIVGFAEQVPILLPGDTTYRADFVVLNRDGTFTVEDAKGVKTPVYRLKKRLVWDRYGIDIREV
jgi:hypothetical protein